MDKARLNKLIRRYRKNKATNAERYIVDRWYESFLNDRVTSVNQPEAAGLDAFREKILREVLDKQKPVPLYRRYGTGIAAAFAFFLISVTLVVKYRQADKTAAPPQPAFTVVSTVVGEVKRLTLPDSSVIFLNANSSLRIPRDFLKNDRTVNLQGEAFFEVKTDARRPFKVYTGPLLVRVLGTSFNIRGYSPAVKVTVSVSAGKVRVSGPPGKTGILESGRKLEFTPETGGFVFSEFRAEKAADWKNGTTVLEQASFGELAEVFYNYYGMTLLTDDAAVKTTKYNFTVRASRQMGKTLAQFCRTTGKKYRKEGSKIILY